MLLNYNQIIKITSGQTTIHGHALGSIIPEGVSIDSRTLVKGQLFVAIKGDYFDGHDFLDDLYDQDQNQVVLVERLHPKLNNQIIVKDTKKALAQIAHENRCYWGGRVIAVTGSSGKTSVKNMLAEVIGRQLNTLYTHGNYNNNYGVALTLCRLKKDHQIAVLEIGTNFPGEINELTQLVQPNIGVILNAGPAHLAGLASVFGVAKEKGSIINGMTKQGLVILNHDDQFFTYWLSQAKCLPDKQLQCFSFSQFKATDAESYIESLVPNPITMSQVITISLLKRQLTFNLNSLGMHHAMNACCVALVSNLLGIMDQHIIDGLSAYKLSKGRGLSYQIKLPNHEGTFCLIDETYNANPQSMKAAIDYLACLPGQRLLVLGTMLELGEMSNQYHLELGQYAQDKNIDQLFVIGDEAQSAAIGFGVQSVFFTQQQTMVEAIKHYVSQHSVLTSHNQPIWVLCKGSNGSGLAKVIDLLITEDCSIDRRAL